MIEWIVLGPQHEHTHITHLGYTMEMRLRPSGDGLSNSVHVTFRWSGIRARVALCFQPWAFDDRMAWTHQLFCLTFHRKGVLDVHG
jgi:hypothetical protein